MPSFSFECCLNCKGRHINCHSTCEKYLNTKKEYNKIREQVKAERLKTTAVLKARNEGIKRCKNGRTKNPAMRSIKK